jgi:hypothetical protein
MIFHNFFVDYSTSTQARISGSVYSRFWKRFDQAAYSRRRRPPIPREGDHLFHGKTTTDSGEGDHPRLRG